MPNWRALFRFPKKRNAASHPQTSAPQLTPPADTPKANPTPEASPSADRVKQPQHQSPPPNGTAEAQNTTDKVSTSLINGLTLALRLLKEAVTGIGVPGLEAAVSGVVKVIDIIESVRSNDQDLGELSRRISSVADAIGKSGRFHPKEDVSEALRLRMEAFLNELEFMLFKVNVVLSDRNLASRTANSQSYSNAIADVTIRMDRLISQFSAEGIISLELNVAGARRDIRAIGQTADDIRQNVGAAHRKLDSVRKQVDGVHQKVDSVKEVHIAQEYEGLIEKIPRVHARYNDTSTKPSRPCHPGTRTDLLQGINAWIGAETDDAPYLWLCGEVGVGKTTVAHTIAKEQEGLRQLGASFFFSRHEHDRQAPHLLFPSIAYQLARFDQGVWRALVEVLKPDPDIVNRGLAEQFTKLVLEPLSRSGMASSRTVVIVIDGLDECSDPASVLDAFALGVEYVSVRLRVLVSSRPYAVIQSKFKNTPLYHLATQNHFHDIKPGTLSNDVATYLTWSLREIASRPANRHLPSPWPTEDELVELIDRASGLFIVASTYTKYIDDPFEDNPLSQLKRILSRRRGIGSSPLAELDALYDQVLDDLKRSLRTAQELVIARDIIETVILAESEMTMAACSGLMFMEVSDVRSVLRRLTAVILLPEHEDTAITPFHASFGEYIQDEARCSIRELSVNTTSAHGRIGTRCIAAMTSAARNGLVGVEYDSPSTMPLHLNYASMSLAAHVSLSHSQADGDTEIFLQSGIWTWLNLMSVQSNLEKLNDAVKRAGFTTLLDVEGLRADATTSIGRLMLAKHALAINSKSDIPSQIATPVTESWECQPKVSQLVKFDFSDVNGADEALGDMLRVVEEARRWNMHNYSTFFIESVAVDLDLSKEVRMVVSTSTSFRGLCNLGLYLGENGNLDPMSRVRLASELAKDVRHLHETSPLHCHGWLLAGEILVSAEGKPLLGPPTWGPARSFEDSTNGGECDCLVMKRFQEDIRDFYWPRPEIADFRSPQAEQCADVWDFGSLLFEIITGFMPRERYSELADDQPALGYKEEVFGVPIEYWSSYVEVHVCQARYETAVSLLLDTIEGLEEVKAVLKGCWAFKPQDRWSTREVAEQLEAIFRAAGDVM